MKIEKKIFSEKQLKLLSEKGVFFVDGYDYSEAELSKIDFEITEGIMDSGFTVDGEPKENTIEWENILTQFRKIRPAQ